jgi:hypothetical protein
VLVLVCVSIVRSVSSVLKAERAKEGCQQHTDPTALERDQSPQSIPFSAADTIPHMHCLFNLLSFLDQTYVC